MGLELMTYSITFEWILGARNKAANCLSRLVRLPTDTKATIKMLTATNSMDQHSTQEAKCHTTTKQPGTQNLEILRILH